MTTQHTYFTVILTHDPDDECETPCTVDADDSTDAFMTSDQSGAEVMAETMRRRFPTASYAVATITWWS